MGLPETFSVKQAAEYASVSTKTIIRAYDDKHLKGYKAGRSRRITLTSLFGWMTAQGIELAAESSLPDDKSDPNHLTYKLFEKHLADYKSNYDDLILLANTKIGPD